MSKPKPLLPHAKITPRRSAARGYADHGWLKTFHTFSFASYYDHRFTNFGSLRVLNEDRVAPRHGFPTHPHRDAEIFSYILSGELTHRDSMVRGNSTSASASGSSGSNDSDMFYTMKRGDVQFTTGGTGIAHSEINEHRSKPVHFLQIWVLPWKSGLTPRYHTKSFSEEAKRKGFVEILSPLRAGREASEKEEEASVPAIEGTIPIHADFVMGAGVIEKGGRFEWVVGKGDVGVVEKKRKRNVYVHVPMTEGGRAKVRLDGRDGDDAELGEGDGAFVTGVNVGDVLGVESIGEAEAEVVVLDSD